jgi:tetratricopeptide (TPR) repeat protein
MWFAPTAEDWKRPCLINWQRTWEDAVTVSKETGKPILVCINMDGEIASEHYAGVRYRQADITKLYEPYVTVIASVYRHTPRDHDENGERIPCPRFGGVTCGEHIAIEPFLYEKFMDGQRISPRHIMVELDGKETYDVFHTFDTDSVFQAIRGGIESRPTSLLKEVRGDRTILERVASRESGDRRAVEQAYKDGDAALRRALMAEAAKNPGAAPVELLRLAINGLDEEMSKLARVALARSTTNDAVELIGQSLQVAMADNEREALLSTLTELGKDSPRAKTLAHVNRGLATKSELVNVQEWGQALAGGGSYAAAVTPEVIGTRLDKVSDVVESTDPAEHLNLAEAFVARVLESQAGGLSTSWSSALLKDAQDSVERALKLGADGWQSRSLLCVAAYYLGEMDDAKKQSELAMKHLPQDASSWNAMIVLGVFAEMRREGIFAKMRAREEWPKEWMSDVNAAYSVLLRHPFGDDMQVLAHYDFLWGMGGQGKASSILAEGLKRFPDSWRLHERLRSSVGQTKGIGALEGVYEKLLTERAASEDAAKPTNLSWFAGYASMVVAEYDRRSSRYDSAMAAYGRAMAHFDKSIRDNPATSGTAVHFQALALGGKARVAFHANKLDESMQFILASFQKSPDSAASLDGLNLSTVDTAKRRTRPIPPAGWPAPPRGCNHRHAAAAGSRRRPRWQWPAPAIPPASG